MGKELGLKGTKYRAFDCLPPPPNPHQPPPKIGVKDNQLDAYDTAMK